MKVKQAFVVLIIGLILVSGCSLQKRTYRKGYYVHWNSSLNKKDKVSKHKKVEIPNHEAVIEEPLFASNDKTFIIPVKKSIWDSIKTVSCGDSLWSANGTVSLVKILEIGDGVIKYKRCSNLDGPTFVIPKSYVSKIKYSNGFVEDYEIEKKKELKSETKNSQNNGIDPQTRIGQPASDFYAKQSLITAGILLLLFAAAIATGFYFPIFAFFLAILAFVALILTWIFSTSALKKTKKDPEHNTGRGMAAGALAIAIALTALIVLAAILIIIVILLILASI